MHTDVHGFRNQVYTDRCKPDIDCVCDRSYLTYYVFPIDCDHFLNLWSKQVLMFYHLKTKHWVSALCMKVIINTVNTSLQLLTFLKIP